MFVLIKKIFIGLITVIISVCNHTKCVWSSNQKEIFIGLITAIVSVSNHTRCV